MWLVSKTPAPLLDEKKLRKDGRSLAQFRPICAPLAVRSSHSHLTSADMKTGVVSQASGKLLFVNSICTHLPRLGLHRDCADKGHRGSVCVSTKVHLSHLFVCLTIRRYGPRHNPKNDFSEKGRVECEFKFAPFACTQRRKPQPDEEEKDLSLQVQRALSMCVRLDKYPKSTVDVYCLVLQDDGGALSAAICAGSLALADAGIECFDLVTACQAVRLDILITRRFYYCFSFSLFLVNCV